jgi:hypothetical protein
VESRKNQSFSITSAMVTSSNMIRERMQAAGEELCKQDAFIRVEGTVVAEMELRASGCAMGEVGPTYRCRAFERLL